MKKNVIIALMAATVMAAMALTGCGSAANAAASESPALAASVVPEAVEEPSNAVLAATEEIVEAAQQAAEAMKTPEEEFEALKEHLVYMGGLCIHDPNSDLMMAIFKNDGEPIAAIYELGNTYYGEFTTESGTLDDGREYTRMFIEDVEYGYHFAVSDTEDSFMVGQDGTVYFADDVYEEVAFDMVLDALKAKAK